MSDNKKLISSIDELISRISNNFETDVLRLIKTQSMIKSSEEIINDEVEFLKNNIELIGSKLDEISIKTSEINGIIHLSSEKLNHSNAHFERYLNEYLDLLTAHGNELSKLKSHLEDRLTHGSASLKSLQKYYIAELKAFEHEVDSNLENFKEQLRESIDSELNGDNQNNETESNAEGSADLNEFKANVDNYSETLDLEEVEEVSADIKAEDSSSEPIAQVPDSPEIKEEIKDDNSGEKQPEQLHTRDNKTENAEFSSQVSKDRIISEQERLENEFETYKETFVKKPVKKPPVNETINGDEFYEKMFKSPEQPGGHNHSGDVRKYIVVSILVVWVLAVFGFYLIFIKKDNTDTVDLNSPINIPAVSGEIEENEFIVPKSPEDFKKTDTDETETLPDAIGVIEPDAQSDLNAETAQDIPESGEQIDTASTGNGQVEPELNSTPPPTFDFTVIVKRANIRKGPGKRYAVVETLPFGKQLDSLNEKNGIWVKVKSENGTVGWIGKRLILQN